MRHFSAYRALCDAGLGNRPGDKSGPGDQYLYVDPMLWDAPGIPEELVPWLTLDVPSDYLPEVRPSLEGWMAVGLGDWYFAGRLCLVGDNRDQRQVYFSHGRGWRISDWERERDRDPGVWMGEEAAFTAPPLIADTPMSEPVLGSERDRVSSACAGLLESEFAATVAICAWLLQAIEQRITVVCQAPLGEFRRGGRLATLVSLARAALPFDAKREARIRLYANAPQAFIEGGAHLLAISDDRARDLHGGVILEYANGVLQGPQANPQNVSYATAALSWATAFPDALLPFAAIAGSGVGAAFASGEADDVGEAVAVAYDLVSSASRPDRQRELLLRLFADANARATRQLPWDQLLTPADWDAVSPVALIEAALVPAATPDSRALSTRLRSHLRRRQVTVDAELQKWWLAELDQDVPVEKAQARMVARAQHVILLFDDSRGPLVAQEIVASLLQTVPAAVALTLLSDEVSGPTFARLAGSTPLPQEWLTSVLVAPAAAQLPHVILSVTGPAAHSGWQPLFDGWVRQLVSFDRLPPKVVDAVLAIPVASMSLEAAVAHGEFAVRWDPSGERARAVAAALERLPLTAEERTTVAERALKNTSAFLRRNLSTSWLLAEAPETLQAEVILLLDGRVTDMPGEQVMALLKAKSFSPWLRATKSPELQRVAALEWLRVAVPSDVAVDFESVVAVLSGRVTEKDLKTTWDQSAKDGALRRDFSDLRASLLKCARDLGVCALMAELTRASYPVVEDEARRAAPALFADLPVGVLRALSPQPEALDLTAAEAILLLKRAGERYRRVLLPLADALLRAVPAGGEPAAVPPMHPPLWTDVTFQYGVASWVERHFSELTDAALQRLERWIPADVAESPLHDLRPARLAEAIFSKRLDRLGRFLGAGVRVPRGAVVRLASSGLSEAVLALCRAEEEAPIWRQFAEECRYPQPSGHPLTRLADELLLLDAPMRQRLAETGWRTGTRVLATFPVLGDAWSSAVRPLPAFSFLVRAGDEVPLWSIACTLIDLQWKSRGTCPTPMWLSSLLIGMRSATRLSGVRGTDDAFEPALQMTAAYVARRGNRDVTAALLAYAQPGRLDFRWTR